MQRHALPSPTPAPHATLGRHLQLCAKFVDEDLQQLLLQVSSRHALQGVWKGGFMSVYVWARLSD